MNEKNYFTSTELDTVVKILNLIKSIRVEHKNKSDGFKYGTFAKMFEDEPSTNEKCLDKILNEQTTSFLRKLCGFMVMGRDVYSGWSTNLQNCYQAMLDNSDLSVKENAIGYFLGKDPVQLENYLSSAMKAYNS
ncbi:hypothetical protein ACFQ22_01450 [Lentilactobacillus raoultii]|uniref:Uncharacterized protein n=1 Tax=Lentilactobacillus raoultii TaxID=1987503 RepID=A0ABW3PCX8_9LACO|nr:hypothetical protein [Lentilactobacillus raoultii]